MAILDRRTRVSGEIPTSSVADIAFLLLVFFLVTTVFPKDRGLALVLPTPVEAPVPARNVLHLLIQSDGVVEVRRGDSDKSVRMAAAAVEDLWRMEVVENPRLIAAVKTDPNAPYRRMVDVLDALHSAGARRVSLQVIER
ncbi:MAG: biopolymer transporter ExbD [Gemmatimonadota bacterium]|nr:biopolymer transporter ExbD [Gemmatimonadota bacterium]MDH5759535.1 biopolymer transporter ExbD [Gemmatimonadota bacterium]